MCYSFISYRSPSPARIKSAMPMNDGNQKSSSQAQPYVVSIELQFDCMPMPLATGSDRLCCVFRFGEINDHS